MQTTSIDAPPTSTAGFASSAEEAAFYREWIAKAADVCRCAAAGDLEPRIVHAPREGDLGALLFGINHMLDMTDAFVRESGASLEHAAEGKFFRRVIPRGMHGAFHRASGIINRATEEMAHQSAELASSEKRRREMGAELNEVVQTLASSATEMRATAQTLASVAMQTTDQSVAAATAAEETSENMSKVAAAAGQLRQESTQVDAKTRECVALTKEASKQAVEAGPVVENLAAVSRRVSDVVRLVSQIAWQTNLLALNATIEAARAGEAGRGFAVVAVEVKDLARKTASAAEEIATEIQSMEDAAARVSGALNGICHHIQGVDRISDVIAQSVERQRLSADEIAQTVERTASATREVSTSVQSVSGAAKQTGSCATQLLDASDELSRQSETLRSGTQRYLQETRA